MLQLQNSPHGFIINVNHCVCTRFTILEKRIQKSLFFIIFFFYND